jgi:hypothetical protein
MSQNEPKQPWEARVTETASRVQEELRRVVRYIDDEVVPEVRRNGSSALRSAANRLQQLAQHMDDARTPTESKSPGDPESK